MGVVTAHSWPKTKLCEVSQGKFAAVSAESTAIHASFRHCRWTMDTPLHSWDKGTIKTMGSQLGVCTIKGKDHSFSREDYGNSVLGFARNNPYQLFGKE
jgi:hypothetical protein